MRLLSDKQACPRRRTPLTLKTVLSCRQPERGGKAFWDAQQLDPDLTGRWRTRMASQPLLPGETIMRSLRAGQDHVRCARLRGGRRRQAHLDALVSHELQTGAPVFSSARVVPEQRGRTNLERMHKQTHLAGLRGSAAIPLTLLA